MDTSDLARLHLRSSLLAERCLITKNAHALLKEAILRRDGRLLMIMCRLDSLDSFVNAVQGFVEGDAHALFLELFKVCPLEMAKSLSKSERESNKLDDKKSLIYGEIDFQSVFPSYADCRIVGGATCCRYFARVMRKLRPLGSFKFYDLGSGSSRALFVAR